MSYLEEAKDQIINIIIQKQLNPEYKINAIGICSDKGMGKTSLVKSISNNPESIDVSNLNSGSYLVKVTTNQGSFTQKIIKK